MKSLYPPFLCQLLVSCPRAGNGVNLYIYKLARQLHYHHTEDEINEILRSCTDGCGRTVPDEEILRAVQRTKRTAWRPGRGPEALRIDQPQPLRSFTPSWPEANEERREAIIREGYSLADLWQESPCPLENNENHAEEIIDQLFPGNPLLCCGTRKSWVSTRPREDWRGKLSSLQFIVPSPMSARTGFTQDGQVSQRALSNTGPRRFLVVEFDADSTDDHAALLRHLSGEAPLALAVYSGGKSLHGWFFCERQPEQQVQAFMRYAVSLGADPATWTRNQLVRMPDGTRDDGERQGIYFFDPEVIR